MTDFTDGAPVTLTGTVAAVETHTSRQGNSWATATLTAPDGDMPVVVPPRTWLAAREHLAQGARVTVAGHIDAHGRDPELVADAITGATKARPAPLTTDQWQHAVDSHDLVAGPAYAYGLPDGTVELAVHIATGDDLTEAARQQVHEELHTAIEDTFRRVLGRIPGRSGGTLHGGAQ